MTLFVRVFDVNHSNEQEIISIIEQGHWEMQWVGVEIFSNDWLKENQGVPLADNLLQPCTEPINQLTQSHTLLRNKKVLRNEP